MSTEAILNCKTFAFAIVILTLAALAIPFLSQSPDEGPMVARTLQGGFYPALINVTVTNDVGRVMPYSIVKVSGNSSNIQTNGNGMVLVSVMAEESGTGFILWANKTGYENSTAGQVTAYANQTSSITLEVKGAKIGGSVMSASTPSIPVAGAVVSISALGYSVIVNSVDGSYTLEGIPGGTQFVTASALGYVSKSQDVRLPVGGFALSNFILTSQTGSISGFVSQWSHTGPQSPLNGTDISVKVETILVTVSSGADGSYNITNLPAGTYSLTASKTGFYDNTSVDIIVTRGNWTRNVNFTLEEKPTLLHGVVRSGNLLLVRVNISVSGTSFFNLTGADGSYEIHNLTAGTYTINATKEGYQPFSKMVDVLPGGEAELLINLTGIPGAILRGVIVSSEPNHQPLTYALVTIVGDSQGRESVLTNIKGEFEFTGLAAGNYTLDLQRDGYRPLTSDPIVVENNKTTEVNYQMMPLRHGFSGFIFGFDMAHSMMILALFLTIVILAVAVYLRIRTFQAPESAPAVYDQAEEETSGTSDEASDEKDGASSGTEDGNKENDGE